MPPRQFQQPSFWNPPNNDWQCQFFARSQQDPCQAKRDARLHPLERDGPPNNFPCPKYALQSSDMLTMGLGGGGCLRQTKTPNDETGVWGEGRQRRPEAPSLTEN